MEEKKLYRAVTQMSPVIYKDFYKIYYRERLKAFNVIAMIISVAALFAAILMINLGLHTVWVALALWICLFFLVYPRMAYRRQYKRDKDRKQTTYFDFYPSYVAERTGGERSNYNYSNLMRVIETKKYFFIYHTPESISIVDKSAVKEGSEGLAELLKSQTEYKKIKQ